jgi:hypothetical protein
MLTRTLWLILRPAFIDIPAQSNQFWPEQHCDRISFNSAFFSGLAHLGFTTMCMDPAIARSAGDLF